MQRPEEPPPGSETALLQSWRQQKRHASQLGTAGVSASRAPCGPGVLPAGWQGLLPWSSDTETGQCPHSFISTQPALTAWNTLLALSHKPGCPSRSLYSLVHTQARPLTGLYIPGPLTSHSGTETGSSSHSPVHTQPALKARNTLLALSHQPAVPHGLVHIDRPVSTGPGLQGALSQK